MTAGASTLLLEVGCEEIPDRMVEPAGRDLGQAVLDVLKDQHLLQVPSASDPFPGTIVATPRRLAAEIEGVLMEQPDQLVEIRGPAVQVAFGPGGKPTRAALGFAAGQEVKVEDLVRVSSDRGEVVMARRLVKGRRASEVLSELLPAAVLSLSFPKSMFWGKGRVSFVRPIRWVVALLDEQVLPLTIAGVAAGRLTFPRRGTAQAPVRLGSASAYGQALKDLGIQGEPRLRRRDIQLRVVAEAKKAGGRAMVDPDLLGIVTNLVEIPGCFAGEYPEVFLELPPEVLTTTLKHHQRCFSVQDGGGNLLPRFVAVVNRPDDPEGLVRTGYQRVIAGRLADARFFYMEDRKQPLESRIEVLERTRLHPRLGSYAAKIRRQDQLVIDLCRWVEADETTVLHCRRAARLAKCDLATQVENEFPELQGRVGGIYAREEGEPAPVWQAIYDQYLPAGLEDQLPRGLVGSLLSVADRADLLVGLMGVGVVPKGSRDPFALRRSALGLVRILVERSLHLSVRGLLARALELFTQQKVEWQLAPDEIVDRVSGFVAGRLQFLLERRKDYRYDSIAAVMAAGGDDPADAAARLEALTEIRKQEDFLALVGAAKRIRNILKQAGSDLHQPQLGKVDEALLTETAEKDLLDATRRVRRLVTDCLKSRDHGGALRAMASLGPQVDRFFDTVLVMAGDERTRRQRLALLATIAGLYQEEADFAEIVVEGSR